MKIVTKRCMTGALMLQLGGNTLHSIYRRRDKLGTYYDSDRFSGTFAKTITEAKAKTTQMVKDGRFGDYYVTLLGTPN